MSNNQQDYYLVNISRIFEKESELQWFHDKHESHEKVDEILDCIRASDSQCLKSKLDDLSLLQRSAVCDNRIFRESITLENVEAIQELLSAGLDPLVSGPKGLTPLHMAVSLAKVEIVEVLLPMCVTPDPLDMRRQTPLHYCALSENGSENSCTLITEKLLHSGAKVNAVDSEGRLPLHIAALTGKLSMLNLLISHSSVLDVSSRDNKGNTPLHNAVRADKNKLEIVYSLINHECDIDAVDSHGRTALHVAGQQYLQYKEDFTCSCIKLLVEHGASVNILDKSGQNVLSKILTASKSIGAADQLKDLAQLVEYLIIRGSQIVNGPTMKWILTAFHSIVPEAFNNSITSSNKVRDSPDFVLMFNIQPLIDFNGKYSTSVSVMDSSTYNTTEMTMLEYMMKSGHKSLMCHPLIRLFLHLKWLRVRQIIVLSTLFYTLFALTSSVYFIHDKYLGHYTGPHNSSHVLATNYKATSFPFLIILYILLVLKELIQITYRPSEYIMRGDHIVNITMVVAPTFCVFKPSWKEQLSSLIIIASWLRLMLCLGSFPSCGVYITMFSTVTKNVLKFSLIYLFPLIAFALAFSILTKEDEAFQNFPRSIVTTFIMMTGELDYRDNFLNKDGPLFNSLFLTPLFVFLVFIILSNLLVGLAVSDMYAIQQRSETIRLSQQAKLMLQLEVFAKNSLVPKIIREYLSKRLQLVDIEKTGSRHIYTIYPNESPGVKGKMFVFLTNTVFCGNVGLALQLFKMMFPNFSPPPSDYDIPEDIIEEAISIALLGKELELAGKSKMTNLKISRKLSFSTPCPLHNVTSAENECRCAQSPYPRLDLHSWLYWRQKLSQGSKFLDRANNLAFMHEF